MRDSKPRRRARHDEEEEDDDDVRPTRRASSRRRDEEEEEEDERPVRRRGSSRDDDDDDDERLARRKRSRDDDEEEEEKPSRRRSSRSRDEEEEEDDDDAPRRKKRSRHDDDDDDNDEPSGKRGSTSGSGWGKAAAKSKKMKEDRENSYADFWLKDGETAYVQFIDGEPYCVDGHGVQLSAKKFQFVPCQLTKQRHCLLCEGGVKEQWKAIFRIWDYRGEWDKAKERFKHNKPVEKVWAIHAGLSDQLHAFITKKKKDLTDVVLEITRSGEGTKATYNIGIAYDDDTDAPMKPDRKLKGALPPLNKLFAPPSDDEVTEKYI